MLLGQKKGGGALRIVLIWRLQVWENIRDLNPVPDGEKKKF